MSYDNEILTILATSHRSLADQLDELAERRRVAPDVPTASVTATGTVVRRALFDPEHDVPPVTPTAHGTREEEDWCVIVFFGRLRALNVRQGTGADENEQRAIGNAAGYKGRAGFNGWPWTWEDRKDGRWITDDEDLSEEDQAKGRLSGMAFLRQFAKRLDVKLPADLA